MAMNSTNSSVLLTVGLKKIIDEQYALNQSIMETIFNINTSTKAYEEWAEMGGIGPAEVKVEGAPIIYKDTNIFNPKRITFTTYGLGMRATQEAKEDDQYGKLKNLAKLIGRAHRARRNLEMANIFNGAFVTTLNTGRDGLALASASHTLANPTYVYPSTTIPNARTTTTWSNYPTAADLDYISFTDAVTLLIRTPDESGEYINISPKWLVTAPENWVVASELLKSTLRPDTANNNINAAQGMVTPVWDPLLFDTDAWFLVADKSQHDLQFFDRRKFSTKSEDDFDTGDTLYKGDMRIGAGFGSARGVVCNPGA